MPKDFVWHGDAQKKRIAKAVKGAIDETTILCVGEAVRTVHKVTTVLQGSIDFIPAEEEPNGDIAGEWGSKDVNYAVYEEILHPYLRPAADKHYPGLTERIAKRLK